MCWIKALKTKPQYLMNNIKKEFKGMEMHYFFLRSFLIKYIHLYFIAFFF